MGSTDSFDHERYPKLTEYLASLPDGLASYPECKAKGTLIKSIIEGQLADDLTDGAPVELANVIRNPPTFNQWVPATWSDALFYLVVDRKYPTEEAMIDWCYKRTLKMGQSAMYRALVRAAGPKALLKMGAKVHDMFQRGTTLRVELGAKEAELFLEHPPYLHGGWNHLSNVGLFRALLRMTGVHHPQADMVESAPKLARYVLAWD